MPDGAGTGLVLRRALPADAPAMAAILNAVIAEGDKTAIAGPLAAPAIADLFLTGPDCSGCTLALVGGQPVGFQALDVHYLAGSGWADISSFVAADARGTGIGRGLWRATQALAGARGLTGLRAVIRSVNAGALAYYRACGFDRPTTPLPRGVDVRLEDRTLLFRALA